MKYYIISLNLVDNNFKNQSTYIEEINQVWELCGGIAAHRNKHYYTGDRNTLIEFYTTYHNPNTIVKFIEI